jgi:hypothetical protein
MYMQYVLHATEINTPTNTILQLDDNSEITMYTLSGKYFFQY